MNSLIGTYECKVDAKGRLMLPSAIKKQLLPSLQNGFVLKRAVFQPCLELYPMVEWELLMQKMKKLKAVQHVYVVSEHSEIDFRMIGHMTKKLLKF